jgi:hypothetical protein
MVCRDLIYPPSGEEMEYYSDMTGNDYKMLPSLTLRCPMD